MRRSAPNCRTSTSPNQTTIPLGYVDPATEIVRQGDTQLWKITHNGVDSHFIHFHLFNVQVINRVGWDGSLRPPDANEMGWKDTVRMNPLEDIIVALAADHAAASVADSKQRSPERRDRLKHELYQPEPIQQ